MARTMVRALLATAAGAGLALGADVTAQFTGSGTIQVLQGSSFATATPADSIGCVDAAGRLTMDDCAVFTRQAASPYNLYTDSGYCTFRDATQPVNTDSAYGDVGTYAWACNAKEAAESDNDLYTVSGFDYPFICNGDEECYYDVPHAPNATSDSIDIWIYYWGDEQEGITPGHLQALMLWVSES